MQSNKQAARDSKNKNKEELTTGWAARDRATPEISSAYIRNLGEGGGGGAQEPRENFLQGNGEGC